ncbi:MAG TPA: cyclic nucleotide-binding domain-containing protein [Spirochaetota bacterium]|nr:cyclic nucleotide-binding domain-containing protein [Spirochaetota bacterium]
MTRVYKPGSIIYFENDKSEYIYILKSGRVILTYTKIDTGEELKEEVRQGEFFGVKSALGKYPREETAQTIGETVVLALSLSDFEKMILKNVNVVRKMLRVFSNQLRRLNRTVRTVLGDSDNVNPQLELFRIGEHYFKIGDFTKAIYAFKKYMEYYPDTDYAKLAMDRIRTINSGGAVPDSSSAPAQKKAASDSFSMDESSDGFSFDESPAPSAGKKSAPSSGFSAGKTGSASEFSSEIDDFLSDDDDLGDFSLDEPSRSKGPSLQETYDKGEASLDMNNYSAALELFRDVITKASPLKPNEKRLFIDSYYNSGVCSFEMKDLKGAMSYFAEITRSYSDSDKLKGALFYIGRIFEIAGQGNKALGYYNKVMNMKPRDSINSRAMDRIQALQKNR